MNVSSPKSIIFIHGMWSQGSIAARLGSVMENWNFDFHTPNLPEHNGQDFCQQNLSRMSISDYARSISEYIEANQIDSPVLIGHSMGGLIAQLVAAEREVDSLVLLNSAAPYGVNHIYPEPFYSTSNIFLQPMFWKSINRPSFARARYSLFNELDDQAAQETYEALVPESGRCFAEIVFWWLDRLSATKIEKKVSGRKLIVSGGQDRIIKPIVAEKLRNLYPEADFRLFPSNGHWLFGEPNDELIFQGIADWLKQPASIHHSKPVLESQVPVEANQPPK